MKQVNALRAAAAIAALAATGALVAGGSAASADVAKGSDATIKIKGNGHPRFVVPESMDGGSTLGIVNRTNPDAIGPHTFSLVDRAELPRGIDELKRCGKIKGICKQIANDHGVFPPADFEIDEYDVENGATGWDTSYAGDTSGDSWFTETEDETTERQMLATGNVWFMCVVHPDMQGHIKVNP